MSSPLSRSDQRRNFALGVVNGSLFRMAEVFIDSEMVLTWFLAQLGAANLLIGLIPSIRMGGWFLPQIFVSGYLQRQSRRLPFYRLIAFYRLGALLLQILVISLIPAQSPWLLWTFLGALVLYSVGSGLAGIPFLDMVGKVIPPTRRGAFFGQRAFWGGTLALGTSALVGVLLNEPDGLTFPYNFSVLFALAFLVIGVSAVAWCMIKEPAGDVDLDRVRWTDQVRRGARLLAENARYRTFVLARLSLMLAQLAAPFYIVYAKTSLGISPGMVGVYLTARTAASILFNLLWGRISDRRGNRLLIRLTNAVGLLMPLLAISIGALGSGSLQAAGWLAGLYTLVFVASGAYATGSAIGNMGYLLDIAPPAQRPLYLGFTNTVFGIGIFTSSLGGLIVDWAGFATVLALSAGFYGLALFFSLLMSEPRRSGAHAEVD